MATKKKAKKKSSKKHQEPATGNDKGDAMSVPKVFCGIFRPPNAAPLVLLNEILPAKREAIS